MFSEVDNTIFPDSCEVIEIVPSQHYVYPIFKCGRSSLTESMEQKGWSFVAEQDIKKIQQPITVFLREPRERFVSGINTFLQHLQNYNLDQDTALFFINKYLFLNRHYAPQFFWLLNLIRFASNNVELTFRHMNEITQLTTVHSDAGVAPMTEEIKSLIDKFDWSKLELYIYLDQILLDHVNQTVRFNDLIKHVKTNHQELYQLIFQRSRSLIDVLS